MNLLLKSLYYYCANFKAKLHLAQEVGNVENRKGVNEKYYFSNTVSLCA